MFSMRSIGVVTSLVVSLVARGEVTQETVDGVLEKIGYKTNLKLELDTTEYQKIWFSKKTSVGGADYDSAIAVANAKLVVVVSGCKNVWWWETKLWDNWSQFANWTTSSGFQNTISKEKSVYNKNGALVTSTPMSATDPYYLVVDAPMLNGGLRGQMGEWTQVEGVYVAVPNGVRNWQVKIPDMPTTLQLGESRRVKAYLVDAVTKETNTTDTITMSLTSEFGNVKLAEDTTTDDPHDFTLYGRATQPAGIAVKTILSLQGETPVAFTNAATVKVAVPGEALRYIPCGSVDLGRTVGNNWWVECQAASLLPISKSLKHAPFGLKIKYTANGEWSNLMVLLNTTQYPRFNVYSGGFLSAGKHEDTIYFADPYDDLHLMCFSLATGYTIDSVEVLRRFVPLTLSVR